MNNKDLRDIIKGKDKEIEEMNCEIASQKIRIELMCDKFLEDITEERQRAELYRQELIRQKILRETKPDVEELTAEEKNIKHRKRRKNSYIKDYNKIREQVLERDDYRCSDCGEDKNLHVHHKIHRSNGGGNELENLITLCEICHAETHKDENVYHIMKK